MADSKADITADRKHPILDDEEMVMLMEPLLISEGSRFRSELTDLAVDLAARWMPGLFPERTGTE